MKQENKILIIIPAHNEASNIAGVLTEVKEKCPFADILVVNDGSDDATGEIASRQEVKVIDIPFWIGIGPTMQTGYIFAQENGYDIAIQLDADGQHDPSEIKELIQPILRQESDVVIGSRFLERKGYRADFLRRLGIKLISTALFLVTAKKFTDPTSGFRAASRAVIIFYGQNYPTEYPEAEAIVLLMRKNFRLKEIPAVMRPRMSGVSSIRKFHAIYYMVEVILAILITGFGYRMKRI